MVATGWSALAGKPQQISSDESHPFRQMNVSRINQAEHWDGRYKSLAE
jgi:hypothetical protein